MNSWCCFDDNEKLVSVFENKLVVEISPCLSFPNLKLPSLAPTEPSPPKT